MNILSWCSKCQAQWKEQSFYQEWARNQMQLFISFENDKDHMWNAPGREGEHGYE